MPRRTFKSSDIVHRGADGEEWVDLKQTNLLTILEQLREGRGVMMVRIWNAGQTPADDLKEIRLVESRRLPSASGVRRRAGRFRLGFWVRPWLRRSIRCWVWQTHGARLS